MQLEGRSVLVTGATGGIGRAIARELARRGCALTVTGRRELELKKLVGELGPPTRALTADLTALGEVRDLMDRAGDVDILVANAGVGIPQDLAMLSDSEIEDAVRINLLAAAPGTNIVVSGDQPTSSVKDVLTEFVEAYNDLRNALNAATAPGLDGASLARLIDAEKITEPELRVSKRLKALEKEALRIEAAETIAEIQEAERVGDPLRLTVALQRKVQLRKQLERVGAS